ncbi:unnamed protein product [Didymodactylos carnosus]|uniref:Calcipressin-like protein n=1 Tax=Didymodactylos carnosus TaxID=1234261 RepID=A0A813VHP4_9BILA|nr:unnamed protein product [Didymodactylos carnosus]CAF1108253.1 unnamed protein product [Didymodactylos carnosus]CAF3624042.1 unnamed protein product [Didymodactylos carnosus]CAF3873992.1 unnamed protein product [Didymodactylos carnosus]
MTDSIISVAEYNDSRTVSEADILVHTSLTSLTINNQQQLANDSLSLLINQADQVETKDYYINYIDDPEEEADKSRIYIADEINQKSVLTLNKDTPLTQVVQRSLRYLEVTHVPETLFTDDNIRLQFESIFHEYDPEVVISYSQEFNRCYLTFSDVILALQIQANMNGKEFQGKNMKVIFSVQQDAIDYLKPPEHERVFMQSPPTTPPIGWVVQREAPPSINLDLFLALSKLQPHEPLEILSKQGNLPAIIIHPCSDTSSDEDENGNVTGIKTTTTTCRENKESPEEKRRVHILHDAIFIPGDNETVIVPCNEQNNMIGAGDKN